MIVWGSLCKPHGYILYTPYFKCILATPWRTPMNFDDFFVHNVVLTLNVWIDVLWSIGHELFFHFYFTWCILVQKTQANATKFIRLSCTYSNMPTYSFNGTLYCINCDKNQWCNRKLIWTYMAYCLNCFRQFLHFLLAKHLSHVTWRW